MPAAQAAEVLNLFAAGRGPADICSADGRATLRGAVRAYGREMQEAGVAWPAIPGAAGETQNVTALDVSVMVAFAAGFVETGDFQHPARRFMTGLTFAQWPEIQSMRMAAREACEDVAALQQAAARVVIEQTRLADMVRSAERNNHGVETVNRLRRQSAMLDRARAHMEEQAAILQVQMDAQRL